MLNYRRLVVVAGGIFLTLLLWLSLEAIRELAGFEHNFWWLLADIAFLSIGVSTTIIIETAVTEKIKRRDKQWEKEKEVEDLTGGITIECDNGETVLMTKDGISGLNL